MLEKPKISVIGVGYVGLCTAVGFASKGYTVISSDVDAEKVAKIKEGIPPFHEPSLPEMLKQTIENGNLKCLVNHTEKAVLETDITYIAVGTPSKPNGSIDLQFIETVSNDIGKALSQKRNYHVVVVKSTVVPGTVQNTVKPNLEKQSEKRCGEDFGLCVNPEFLRQGSAFYDTFNADRVVIGSFDQKSGDAIEALYKEFYYPKLPPIIRTSLATAELIKYANNAMLATKISFINTIANICEKIPGADVKTVAKAMGLDKRIGPLFLDAGLGYGGSCFPKDVKALIACSKAFGYASELLESVENLNHTQPLKAVEFCKQQLGNLSGKNIAILGLAFKPDTDDMREARVVPIINQLLLEGATIIAYDPVAMNMAKSIFQDKIQYASSAIRCIKNTDAAILVTEWEEFKKLAPEDFLKNMRQPILIDGRRIYDPEIYSKKLNFTAIGFGK
ncbi:MAG TPA: UDP-glucose/GDP-mannose dehydrogenase family protein [Candidatus Acidoferrum sp.]|nr:UDP-glucose/GDP-mannose dehydrogenase family protein [Candidatus Acidoferrum sp.]